MSRRRALAGPRLLLSSLLLFVPLRAGAHGGEDHGAPAVDAAPVSVITISKPLQRALAITTLRVAELPAAAPRRVLGETLPRPEASWRVQAPEAGRLLTASGAWPVAGQAVGAGELLALLEPALGQRERAQRELELASYQQRLSIAQVNVDRLRLQQRANGVGAEGNAYVEQAVAEYEALQRQIELGRQSLAGRVEIRAGDGGRLQRVAVAAGEVVGRGQALFELVGARPRIAVQVYEPAYTRGGVVARAAIAGRDYALHRAGYAPAAPQPGWTLWLDFDGDAPVLASGTPVELSLSLAASTDTALLLPRASVQGSDDAAWVWVHSAPEQFTRCPVQIVETRGELVRATAALTPQQRIAVGGAALLDQYD